MEMRATNFDVKRLVIFQLFISRGIDKFENIRSYK
jgi:hypothetical protein